MNKVFVAGAGTIGPGIAQVFAQAGIEVVLYARSMDKACDGIARIKKGLFRLVERGKLELEQKSAVLARIKPSDTLSDAVSCCLVVETIVEDVNEKKRFFAELDKMCQTKTIFLTNTSSLSVSDIASVTSREDRFAGLHFFNPAPAMKLVEVIRGVCTSDSTFDTIFELCKRLGKEPIQSKDSPGFIVNRILIPMINEAALVLEEGVASADEIDAAMKLGAGHPMGPLALSDLIGNDVVLEIMNTLHLRTSNAKYRPCPLLIKLVNDGYLGKKVGVGFYKYT